MCGRFALAATGEEVAEHYQLSEVPFIVPRYNIAPTQPVAAVRFNRAGERELTFFQWGLIPSWAKDPSIGSRMINARAETVAEKPAFRRAFAKRRCLVPADGYFEWYLPTEPDAPVGKTGKPIKQPFFIHPADGSSRAMAGLYEWWRDPTREDGDPAAWRLTCTVITTEASDDLGRIHDRMPMTVARDDWHRWLDPDVPAAADLLAPASAGRLDAYPVSTLVNSVRNNGPELLAPLAE